MVYPTPVTEEWYKLELQPGRATGTTTEPYTSSMSGRGP